MSQNFFIRDRKRLKVDCFRSYELAHKGDSKCASSMDDLSSNYYSMQRKDRLWHERMIIVRVKRGRNMQIRRKIALIYGWRQGTWPEMI